MKGIPIENPYVFDRPVDDEQLFVGRRPLLQEISLQLRRSESFALLGGTRSGKTTLLFQLKRRLTRDDFPDGPRRVVGPVFLSTHQFDELTPQGVYAAILIELCDLLTDNAAERIREAAQRLLDGRAGNRVFETFSGVLVEELPGRPNFRLVIMLDEIDELREHSWARTFFNNLRHLVSVGPVCDQVSVVIAGTLDSQELWNTAGSPFHNVTTQKELALLPDEALFELVDMGFPAGLDASVQEALFDAAGGSPYLAQYLLGRLWDRTRVFERPPIDDDVEQVCWAYLDERPGDFQRWWSSCGEDARKLYCHMASAGTPIKRFDAVKLCQRQPDRAKRAIDELFFNGLIRQVGERRRPRWDAPSGLFQLWLEDQGYLDDGDAPAIPVSTKPAPRAPRVFLSYVHQDKLAVERLFMGLTSRRIEVWWDGAAMHGGARISMAVADGIRWADHFVLCCSSNLLRRLQSGETGVLEELDLAVRRDERCQGTYGFIIPVRLDDCELPSPSMGEHGRLSKVLAIDLFRDLSGGLNELASAIVRSRGGDSSDSGPI